MKRCSKCKHDLPLKMFHNRKTTDDGLARECKICRRAQRKKYYWQHRDAALLAAKQYKIEHPDKAIQWSKHRYQRDKIKGKTYLQNKRYLDRYGISLEEARVMYQAQKQQCAICQKAIPFLGRYSYIDHNHTTQQIRGILCPKCNAGIGFLEYYASHQSILEKSQAYLGWRV